MELFNRGMKKMVSEKEITDTFNGLVAGFIKDVIAFFIGSHKITKRLCAYPQLLGKDRVYECAAYA